MDCLSLLVYYLYDFVIDHIWKALLYLYMEDEDLPLPTPLEVLLCSSSTKVEEVKIKLLLPIINFNLFFII